MRPEKKDWQTFKSLLGMVRLVLLVDWDPIGVFGHMGAMDEYDSYAPDMTDLLLSGASRDDLMAHLDHIEKGAMGLRGERVALSATADKLLSILIEPMPGWLYYVNDLEHLEMPSGFDKKAAVAKFDRLVVALEQKLGCKLEQEREIQDASHHGAAFLPGELLKEGWKDHRVSVRASNFGDFAAVYSEGTVVQKPAMKIVIETLGEFDYFYLPSSVLNQRYGEGNPRLTGFDTWGNRFFDYL